MIVSFENKTVLVTGAAAGIGRAIALAAGQAGARLVLGDVSEAGLAETAAQLKRIGAASTRAVCDVRKQADLEALFAKGARQFTHPDVVYANAGILGVPTNVWEYDEAAFAAVIDINLVGTWRTFKAALPKMIERRSGVIVATSSIAGLIGASGLAAYVASKHAMLGLVKATALNVAAQGIRVNALCPHLVETPMLGKLLDGQPSLLEALRATNPMGRSATSEEVANSAIWLGSDQCGYVTGTSLVVDGGHIAQ